MRVLNSSLSRPKGKGDSAQFRTLRHAYVAQIARDSALFHNEYADQTIDNIETLTGISNVSYTHGVTAEVTALLANNAQLLTDPVALENIIGDTFRGIWNFIKKLFKLIADTIKAIWNYLFRSRSKKKNETPFTVYDMYAPAVAKAQYNLVGADDFLRRFTIVDDILAAIEVLVTDESRANWETADFESKFKDVINGVISKHDGLQLGFKMIGAAGIEIPPATNLRNDYDGSESQVLGYHTKFDELTTTRPNAINARADAIRARLFTELSNIERRISTIEPAKRNEVQLLTGRNLLTPMRALDVLTKAIANDVVRVIPEDIATMRTILERELASAPKP